jgi:hypothetical protein
MLISSHIPALLFNFFLAGIPHQSTKPADVPNNFIEERVSIFEFPISIVHPNDLMIRWINEPIRQSTQLSLATPCAYHEHTVNRDSPDFGGKITLRHLKPL